MNYVLSPNSTKARRGVLLVNFGTPSDPSRKAVRPFLSQIFEEHLSSLPWWLRHICISGWIVPRRISEVVHNYRAIWTEEGSPLLVQSRKLGDCLAAALPQGTAVALGMQFGNPSIEEGLESLGSLGIDELTILPLFPQLIPPMAKTIKERVAQQVQTWTRAPVVRFIENFGQEAWYEQVLSSLLLVANPGKYDRVVFSFHALPEKASSNYRELCFQTANVIAKTALLPQEKVCVGFQSREGRRHWTEPSTRSVLAALRKQRIDRVLVICPSFVVDCLENVHEVAEEYRLEFLQHGGTELAVVPALNVYQPWVRAISTRIQEGT